MSRRVTVGSRRRASRNGRYLQVDLAQGQICGSDSHPLCIVSPNAHRSIGLAPDCDVSPRVPSRAHFELHGGIRIQTKAGLVVVNSSIFHESFEMTADVGLHGSDYPFAVEFEDAPLALRIV